VLWDVSDAATSELSAILERVRQVASLRFDPDFQHSAKRRLAFVRFAGVPLFWRVDLEATHRAASSSEPYVETA
jgi:hypothetical protein